MLTIILVCVFGGQTIERRMTPNEVDHLADIQLYSETQMDPHSLGAAHAYEERLCRASYGRMPDAARAHHAWHY